MDTRLVVSTTDPPCLFEHGSVAHIPVLVFHSPCLSGSFFFNDSAIRIRLQANIPQKFVAFAHAPRREHTARKGPYFGGSIPTPNRAQPDGICLGVAYAFALGRIGASPARSVGMRAFCDRRPGSKIVEFAPTKKPHSRRGRESGWRRSQGPQTECFVNELCHDLNKLRALVHKPPVVPQVLTLSQHEPYDNVCRGKPRGSVLADRQSNQGGAVWRERCRAIEVDGVLFLNGHR